MPQTEREKIIKQLDTYGIDGYGELQRCQVVDFILEDRKRIVEPLINFKRSVNFYRKDAWNPYVDSAKAIDKTLKLAGVE